MNEANDQKMTLSQKVIVILTILGCIILAGGAVGILYRQKENPQDVTDYSNRKYWMLYETDSTDSYGAAKDADVFFITPTNVLEGGNADVDSEDDRTAMNVAMLMEIGIYDDNARVFAPYYRQGTLDIYGNEDMSRQDQALALAYEDVKAAFDYYYAHENTGRPIVLAGFSQGADMIYRLMMDEFGEGEGSKEDQLVAAYAIGWPCTEEMSAQYPQLRMAEGETDTGVIISFECESPECSDSFIVPAGVRMQSINPLNWKTDSTVAGRSMNKGYVLTNSHGSVKNEIPMLCGGYIDETRGTLKIADVSPEDYPAMIPQLPEGAYHIYDYMFFYRNLEENVQRRIAAFLSKPYSYKGDYVEHEGNADLRASLLSTEGGTEVAAEDSTKDDLEDGEAGAQNRLVSVSEPADGIVVSTPRFKVTVPNAFYGNFTYNYYEDNDTGLWNLELIDRASKRNGEAGVLFSINMTRAEVTGDDVIQIRDNGGRILGTLTDSEGQVYTVYLAVAGDAKQAEEGSTYQSMIALKDYVAYTFRSSDAHATYVKSNEQKQVEATMSSDNPQAVSSHVWNVLVDQVNENANAVGFSLAELQFIADNYRELQQGVAETPYADTVPAAVEMAGDRVTFTYDAGIRLLWNGKTGETSVETLDVP